VAPLHRPRKNVTQRLHLRFDGRKILAQPGQFGCGSRPLFFIQRFRKAD
jgi:hypothetical protein